MHPSHHAPFPPPPPPPPPRREVDREKTCPFLLRAFVRVGRPHDLASFASWGAAPLPAPEAQIYSWPDATLRELADLLRAVPPANAHPSAPLSFALIFPDRHGRPAARPIGRIFATPGANPDETKTLGQLRFCIGDYLSVIVDDRGPPRGRR